MNNIRAICIIGPISYDPEAAFYAFSEASAFIRSRHPNALIYNPMSEFHSDNHPSWRSAMQSSLEYLASVDHCMILPNSETSTSAIFEILYGLIHEVTFYNNKLNLLHENILINLINSLNLQFPTNFTDMLSVQAKKTKQNENE